MRLHAENLLIFFPIMSVQNHLIFFKTKPWDELATIINALYQFQYRPTSPELLLSFLYMLIDVTLLISFCQISFSTNIGLPRGLRQLSSVFFLLFDYRKDATYHLSYYLKKLQQNLLTYISISK